MIARRLLPILATAATSVAFAACAPADEGDGEEEATSSDDALRRYEDAERERPEVGVLRFASGSYCTGTLIGPRTVLTAAHCVGFASGVHAAGAPAPGAFEIHDVSGRVRKTEYRRFRSDANVLQTHFDLAVIQLDAPVAPSIATPAVIAERWTNERLTVYGFGRYGVGCKLTDRGTNKRKTTVPPSFPFVTRTTCPGDSGGPYFRGTSNEIVATVKGDGLGLEWVADAVRHRDWILARRAESEGGELSVE